MLHFVPNKIKILVLITIKLHPLQCFYSQRLKFVKGNSIKQISVLAIF